MKQTISLPHKAELTPSDPTAENSGNPPASIITKVMQDIATGNLRFALVGTSDGGIEIWRAAADSQKLQKQPLECSPAATAEPLVCDARAACKLLGIGITSLWSLEQRGIIKRLPDFPKARYSVEHLKEVVRKQATKKITRWVPV